jgi:hypothetical protein
MYNARDMCFQPRSAICLFYAAPFLQSRETFANLITQRRISMSYKIHQGEADSIEVFASYASEIGLNRIISVSTKRARARSDENFAC